jgi:phosphoribosyl-ATP pyrophosphohydrolase/phosphoribosyl-AMP cyclohydrolase
MREILDRAVFNADGLIPAVVQDARTREVLTVAYMNEEALRLTIERGETHFWSRSRRALWRKGETSGNFQKVHKVSLDCDADTVLVEVSPQGPACHTGAYSCFGVQAQTDAMLNDLYEVIERRKRQRPQGSYTAYLFDKGLDKILKKVGEEATEVVIAAKNPEADRLAAEASDLIYHLLVLLVERGVSLDDVRQELKRREKPQSDS